MDYSYDYSDMTTSAPYFQYGGPTAGFTTQTGVPITNSFTNRLKESRTPAGGQKYAYYLPASKTEVNGHNLTASYEINDELAFKSITGYR